MILIDPNVPAEQRRTLQKPCGIELCHKRRAAAEGTRDAVVRLSVGQRETAGAGLARDPGCADTVDSDRVADIESFSAQVSRIAAVEKSIRIDLGDEGVAEATGEYCLLDRVQELIGGWKSRAAGRPRDIHVLRGVHGQPVCLADARGAECGDRPRRQCGQIKFCRERAECPGRGRGLVSCAISCAVAGDVTRC